ncbi:MAG TPA: hypothetical protein VEJ18_06760 [Planctomycetota bacterium]|nr:hypothetical protein [Planctomycetota bacterium]
MPDLRLKLVGRTLLFPDDRPVCLRCGAPATAVRRARIDAVTFDAPLCDIDLGRAGRLRSRALTTWIVAIVWSTAIAAAMGGREAGWVGIPFAVVPWIFAARYSRRARRAGLTCRARRDGGDIVLEYPKVG